MIRRKVIIQSRDEAVDAYGQRSTRYTTVSETGAIVSAQGLSETFAGDRDVSINALLFRLPYGPTSSSISNLDRLVYQGRNYEVVSVDTSSFYLKEVRVVAELIT